ncbi:MAG TPA: tetratricopeptide repeat protein [Planctomycetota bacterium]|nr:tetratricopeptide repeat protein [Planctomycetota bacterium]
MRRWIIAGLVVLGACVAETGERDVTVSNLHILQDADREFVLEQYLQAAGHYEAFLAYNPLFPQRTRVRLMAGRAYLGAGRLDQAISTFDQALGGTPPPLERWDLIFHRAVAYRMKGEIARALEGFRMVGAAPSTERSSVVTHDEYHYELALALFRDGDWKGGQSELALVAPRGPFGKKARMRLGLTSFAVQVGAYEDDARARSEAEKVKGILRPIPGDRPLYAVTWGSFNRYEDAQREADRLRRQYPDAFVIP